MNSQAERLLSLSLFVDSEVLKLFKAVVDAAVKRMRFDESQVRVLEDSPWLYIDEAIDCASVYPIFHLYAYHHMTSWWGERPNPPPIVSTDFYEERGEGLLIGQRLWEAIVTSLALSREEVPEKRAILEENLTFNLGYLHGIYRMDEDGNIDRVRRLGDRDIYDATRVARDAKAAKSPKVGFINWFKQKLFEGFNPQNVNDIRAMEGFEWDVVDGEPVRDDRLRRWVGECGHKLTGGRPKNN